MGSSEWRVSVEIFRATLVCGRRCRVANSAAEFGHLSEKIRNDKPGLDSLERCRSRGRVAITASRTTTYVRKTPATSGMGVVVAGSDPRLRLARHFNSLQYRIQHVIRREAFDVGVGLEHEAVAEDRASDAFDVVGGDEAAAVHE